MHLIEWTGNWLTSFRVIWKLEFSWRKSQMPERKKMWIKLKMINFYVPMFIVSFASFHCPLHSNHLCSHFNAAVLLHLHFTEFLFIFQMIHLILCLYAENRQANFRMSCILQYCIPSFFVICFERKNKSIWLILCFSWNRFGKMSQKDSNVIIIT